MAILDQNKINSLRQEVSSLRDAAVSANTIKSQMETQIKNEVDQICNMLPQSVEEAYPDENIGIASSVANVKTAAEAIKADITDSNIENFTNAVSVLTAKIDDYNLKRLSDVEALIEKWKSEIEGGGANAE